MACAADRAVRHLTGHPVAQRAMGTTLSRSDFDPYVGIPWLDRGRDRAGCDCWGLARLVYLGLAGIELPSHRDDYATAADRAAVAELIAGGKIAWREVDRAGARPLDLISLRRGGRESHVGIAIGGRLMLHVSETTETSCIEVWESRRWITRVAGVFRHEALDEALA